MQTRIALLAAALFANPALAQVATPSPTPSAAAAPAAAADLVPVAIDTSLGRIVIALDRGKAPVTTANFLHYVDSHRLDGESFYRAMHVGSGGLIQGGITSDARKLYPPITDEPSSKTGLHNVAGAISMARGAPGSATSDFFILLTDQPGFDAGAPGGTDPDGFAPFGHVTEGMDVVRQIFAAPVSATKGIGPMKGQMLEPPVKIIKAARVK
ncbi:peptidylprolyl isomerase [Sphingomonas sp.]|uniref:peptidylprolyl isomerase n=1 Tax=Sphingomonas sp. TaxID=28214 RepID=UPI0025E88122|nr:peptidylprolyl isomerase [Sphingomonas sp.]MBV9528044.1 peptidylprolyl isomerase [Sphingomonas sp.]